MKACGVFLTHIDDVAILLAHLVERSLCLPIRYPQGVQLGYQYGLLLLQLSARLGRQLALLLSFGQGALQVLQ